MTGRFLPYPAIYAVYKLAQPPDSRTYSAEVTSFLSNLPHHRRLRPLRRPVIIQHTAVCVKRFCKKILADFPGFPNAALWVFQKTRESPLGWAACSRPNMLGLCTRTTYYGGKQRSPNGISPLPWGKGPARSCLCSGGGSFDEDRLCKPLSCSLSHRLRRCQHPYPLCRFATSPPDRGSRPSEREPYRPMECFSTSGGSAPKSAPCSENAQARAAVMMAME